MPRGERAPALGTPVVFVSASDLRRAAEFYGGKLGLPLESEDRYACVFRAGTTTLRVTRVGTVVRAPYTVLGWVVPDLRAMLDDLSARGVEPERFEHLEQDERAVWTAPGGARVAWLRDPDGNVVSLTET